jgi:hypothetical protein
MPFRPFGATHRVSELFVLHFVFSFFVTQQVTNPGFPHVDFAAHLFTSPRQLLFTRLAFACSAAHET